MLSLPGFRGGGDGTKDGNSRKTARPFSGILCDVWTILTALVCLAAWALNDLHFNGRDILLQAAASGDGDCAAAADDDVDGSCSTSASPDDVSESMITFYGKSSLVLGTAAVLELFQVISYLMAIRHDDAPSRSAVGRAAGIAQKDTLYTLFGWHDSVCMLLVYSIKFAVHFFTMHDATGEELGLIFAEPLAAASGIYRPISTARFIEWTVATPLLLSLIGRSMPRLVGGIVGDRVNVSDTIRPGFVVSIAYMLPAWEALLIVDPVWRWALIFMSFGGFCASAIDQLTAWRRDIDRASPNFWASDFLLKMQIDVFFTYGIVYLLPIFGLLSPTAEQAVFTLGDCSVKLACSAALAAMRHADALAEARRSRKKADLIAGDLRRMIKDSAAPIFAVDNYLRVNIWNDKLAALTNMTFVEVNGKNLDDLISLECKDEVTAIFHTRKDGISGSNLFHCDFKMSLEEGASDAGESLISLVMSASARRDAEGNIVGIVGIGQDTTEVTRIRAIEEKKDQLMAVVSHELKSPLHGIIGLSESLAQSEKVETRKDQLKMVKSCAARLLDLVSNIMQMSKLRRQGKGEGGATDGAMNKDMLRKDPVDVSSILAEVCMLVSNATDKAMKPILNPLVRLENKAPQNLPIVEGDSYKITQVFYNLLTNACKFCTSGSITVKVGLNGAKDMLEIAISDTGVGIAADSVKRIFGESLLLCLM